jgi:signal peptidase I
MSLIKKIKKTWKWIWNSDSIWSWIVALILIFLIVKFIFFPILSLIFGTSLPLAGVESSSMDHQIVKEDSGIFTLCGMIYSKQQKQEIGHINFDEYWDICGDWYVDNKHITKPIFEKFPMKNGFRKGDIILVWGRFTPQVGDIIIFAPSFGSTAPRPIIHRIVSIDENKTIQTKGDHNKEQLTFSNNFYNTDETIIKEEQIMGKAIFKIPYLGWIKIWFTELININCKKELIVPFGCNS